MKEFLRRYQDPIILTLLLLVSLTLLLNNIREKERYSTPERVILAVFAPFQDAISWGVASIGSTWDRYVALVGVGDENRRLKKEIARLSFEKGRLEEENRRFERIAVLLGENKKTPFRTVVTRVIARETALGSHLVTIDRGTDDLVHEGAALFTHEGVIGRVIRSSASASRALLLTDIRSAVDATLISSRDRLVAEGTGSGLLAARYLTINSPVKTGDFAHTSGLGGVYPAGLRIGAITGVRQNPDRLFMEAAIQPSADLARVEEALVIVRDPEEAPR